MKASACIAAAAAFSLATAAAAQPLPVLRTELAMTGVSGLALAPQERNRAGHFVRLENCA